MVERIKLPVRKVPLTFVFDAFIVIHTKELHTATPYIAVLPNVRTNPCVFSRAL